MGKLVLKMSGPHGGKECGGHGGQPAGGHGGHGQQQQMKMQQPQANPASHETASLFGYDWVEEGGASTITTPTEPESNMSVPDPKFLSRVGLKDVLSGQVITKLFGDVPVQTVCCFVALPMFIIILIETLYAIATRGCGWFSVLAGSLLLFFVMPLLGMALGKMYTYKLAQHYRVSDSFEKLAKQRQLITLSLSSFGMWGMVAWGIIAYSYFGDASDSPLEPYICMNKHGTVPTSRIHNMTFLGSIGYMCTAITTCRCILVGVPLCLGITVYTSDPKEDAIKAAEKRANKGG